jgi:hypothetical protein
MIAPGHPPLLASLGNVKIRITTITVAIATIPNISKIILLDFLSPKSCISEFTIIPEKSLYTYNKISLKFPYMLLFYG